LRDVCAAEVAIDTAGRLIVRPRLTEPADFAFIYRAAMEVGWDPATRSLTTPAKREWSAARWFKQIAGALQSEYGQRLSVNSNTRWHNVPVDIRAEIETEFGQE
jgi:hypothetical protein